MSFRIGTSDTRWQCVRLPPPAQQYGCGDSLPEFAPCIPSWLDPVRPHDLNPPFPVRSFCSAFSGLTCPLSNNARDLVKNGHWVAEALEERSSGRKQVNRDFRNACEQAECGLKQRCWIRERLLEKS